MQARLLEPEWLYELPPQDPRAVRSRADLRRVNWVMANARVLAKPLAEELTPGTRIADLGSGDGSLMLGVARALRCPGMELTLVDRAPIISDATLAAFGELGWKARIAASDALEFISHERQDVIVANLFLHHLDDASLSRLFALAAQRCRALAACEPRRSGLALGASHLLGFIGCNDVTRHDAVVSVRAGFRDDELSRMWPTPAGWKLIERAAPPFSHLFVARHHAP
ncbi:MAG TPA: methyltransferase [Burkholderiales bacterium]|nr:methyltransferase [Burkholderiales bacterium]